MHSVTSNAVANAIVSVLASKVNVIHRKLTSGASSVNDIKTYIANNRTTLVPNGVNGVMNLLILENASGGGCHNVLIGSTNYNHFSILIISYYYNICAFNYTNGTWVSKPWSNY